MPTFFLTLSSADTHWPDMFKSLARINLEENWTAADIPNKPFHEKANLLKKDPDTTVRNYYYRRKAFLNLILKR